jgi:hypothetical protein
VSGRTSRPPAGTGALFLVEVISYPSWQKHGALDVAVDSVYAIVSLAGLLSAVAVLVTRIAARRRVAR